MLLGIEENVGYRWPVERLRALTLGERGSLDPGYTRTDLVSRIDRLSSFRIPPERFGCEFESVNQLQQGFPFTLMCGGVGFPPMFCGKMEI